MLQATITGKVKDTVRFTKPIGGILIKTNQLVPNLVNLDDPMLNTTTGVTNEAISIQLENGSKQIKLVQPKMNMLSLAMSATIEEGFLRILADSYLLMYIPIAKGGSLYMDNGAEIVVSLSGLKSAQEYEVFGIEMPGVTKEAYFYDQVKVLAGRTQQVLNTTEADIISINPISYLIGMEITKPTVLPDGRVEATNHEFAGAEIEWLVSQTNELVLASRHGEYQLHGRGDQLILPISNVSQIELETTGSELEAILRIPRNI